MKKLPFYSFLFLVFFCSNTLFGQALSNTANINWSAEYNEPNNSFLSNVIHSTQDGFYALRIKGLGSKRDNPNILVEYYDKAQMKLKKSAELDLKFKKKQRDFENVIMAGSNMYFLTSFNNQAKITYLPKGSI